MGTTPLRDVVRGRLTGRLDILRACEQAALAPPLRDLVLRTVRATRLWRIEKADVASELIAHFRDGLESGRSAEQLIASFGDPALAARLIRSTKRRSRPIPWKLWLLAWKSVAAFLLLCVLGYGVLFVRFHSGRTVLATNTLAQLNAPIQAIPPEERAWNRYKDAIRASVRLPDTLGSPQAQWPLVPPESRFRAEAVAYLQQNAAAIEHLHAAAAMPRLGYILADHVRPDDPWYDPMQPPPAWERPEWKDNPPIIGVLLPSLGEFRRFTQLLMFDSLLARESGDAARVVRNIGTTIAMAEQTRDLPFLISDLTALAIAAVACREIDATLHTAPNLLSEEQLVALAHMLSGFPRDGEPLVRFESESLLFHDTLQRVYTDDGRGNGYVNIVQAFRLQFLEPTYRPTRAQQALGPVAAVLMADRASMKREYEAIIASGIAAARTPPWQWAEDPDSAFQERKKDVWWRQRFALINELMAATGSVALSQHRFAQIRGATLTAIALSLERRRTGSYPASLDALVPDLLPSVHPDIFDGNSMRYALVGGQPVLYSVGVDRKDDGGRPPKNPHSGLVSTWKPREQIDALMAVNSSREPIDGDWVLYPPLPPLPPPPPEGADE